jgi:hypothetical protein
MNANDLDRELTTMLRDEEGPPDPQPTRSRRGKRLRFVAVALALAAAAAAGVAFAVVHSTSSSSSPPASRSAGGTSCTALVRFRGLPYVGTTLRDVTLQRGRGLGQVTAPGCESPSTTAGAVALGGIDPAVAVALDDAPGVVYVLAGRCVGYSGGNVVSCLQTPLDLGGRHFYATQPVDELQRGAAAGTGSLRGRSVDVLRLQGIAPTVAVAVAGRAGEIFLAPDVCPIAGLPQLVDCLRQTG